MPSLQSIWRRLAETVDDLTFSDPVSHVYNPLQYAWPMHAAYLKKFGGGTKQVLLLGMNPGPYGMAQTGIPFGNIGTVRDWLKLDGAVGRPGREHPKRPITGLATRRDEVSGQRLWGWARTRFGTPERFFGRFLVLNYCPLCFMDAGGKNLTPDRLPRHEQQPLFELCAAALRDSVEILRPEFVVGIGAFATARAQEALDRWRGTVGQILHPSPASPLANRGWQQAAEAQLLQLGIEL